MWFRVELNKDGGIASCKQVSGSFESSRHVRYIEADSAKSASELAMKWWRLLQRTNVKNKERVAAAKTRGLCLICKKATAREGKTSCVACGNRAVENNRRKRAERKSGSAVDRRRDHSRTDAEKYADTLAAQREREAFRVPAALRTEIRLLELIQVEFSLRPHGFGDWIENQLSDRRHMAMAVRAMGLQQPVVTAAE